MFFASMSDFFFVIFFGGLDKCLYFCSGMSRSFVPGSNLHSGLRSRFLFIYITFVPVLYDYYSLL